MSHFLDGCYSRAPFALLGVLACSLVAPSVRANPAGGTVTQGSATFNNQGSHLTIRTSDRAAINWQTFNIGLGQTTTFLQPSSSSIVWNQINDPNPSQILGNLNANGYVILQNQAGFFIGGQAAITAQGLILTTAPIAIPNLSAGGPWDFKAPPPAASIINYGQIQVGNGGSAFLIAHDIDNHGTITAPQGQIGLYAGKEVLLSERPDGRGLSAKVTLPAGSVDNSGKLIADAGTIALHAQVVNQGGLVQADSMREINGVIQLVASDAINLSADSVLSAKGGAQGTSPGGSVLIKSDGHFTDQAGSTIDISGGAQGGSGGQAEISASKMSAINSQVEGHAAKGFLGGQLTIDPDTIYLADWGSAFPGSGTVNAGDPPTGDTLYLNFNTLPTGLSQIKLQAVNDIELSATALPWTLPNAQTASTLTLEAGRNITLDDGSGIVAGRNWTVNLIAGTELKSASRKQAGMDRIFLQGLAYIQTQNGNINLTAGNEVFVDNGTSDPNSLPPYDISNQVGNGITTVGGGSINVTARFGNVTTGGDPLGYTYSKNAPYYSASTTPGMLGGISTARGGDVTITAAGDVTSFMPGKGITSDAGSGAFSSDADKPGNVTITAGGGVYGHFVEGNGVGTITAQTKNVGGTDPRHTFALSLVKGSWSVYAPKGSIYLQEVRNPNGTYNNTGGKGNYLFDYDPLAYLDLEAGNSVEITGSGLPRGGTLVAGQTAPPILLPPSVTIKSGEAGGTVDNNVKLDNNVTLYPSAFGELNIQSAGDLIGAMPDGSRPILLMSDRAVSTSGQSQWVNAYSFMQADHAASPVELGDANPATITVDGNMNNLIVGANKQIQITVKKDMNNSSFIGQNLRPKDSTTIDVWGKIFNRGLYTFTTLTRPIFSVDVRNPTQWDSIFNLLVDPAAIDHPNSSQDPSKAKTPADLQRIASMVLLFQSSGSGHNPGFVYDPSVLRLGFAGVMSGAVRSALEGKLEILQIGPNGLPVVANGHFVTIPVKFVPASAIEDLYKHSQDVPVADGSITGYRIGGPGYFNITAGSLDLGTTAGIESWGAVENNALAKLTRAGGAAVNVTVTGDLTMLTSRIASLFGGDVTVDSVAGSIDLGSQELFGSSGDAFGIYTTGHSNVKVTAQGDININGSRIATYNGGNVTVESRAGDVNAGSGGTTYVSVPIVRVSPRTGFQSLKSTYIYGSGIVTVSLTDDLRTPGGNPLPGNITVLTPQGDIVSQFAGILQLPLDGNLAPGPTITLTAGTAPSKTSVGYKGNIDLGDSGVIGGAITMTAQGDIHGLIISRQNSTINAAQSFSGTLLSAGSASVSAGGGISGTIIAVGVLSAKSGGDNTAALMSQTVVGPGGQTQSTLGTSSTASATGAAAANQGNNDTQKSVAMGTGSTDEDPNKKKQKGPAPTLTRHIGRVTVILPPA